MIVTMTCRSAPLRIDAIDAVARSSNALVGIFRQVNSMEWTVTRERRMARVVAKVQARSGSYTATATGESLEASFLEVVARIKSQRRRRKTTRLRARAVAKKVPARARATAGGRAARTA
jgi:ribosome-associated translation inhibitor RaiA